MVPVLKHHLDPNKYLNFNTEISGKEFERVNSRQKIMEEIQRLEKMLEKKTTTQKRGSY